MPKKTRVAPKARRRPALGAMPALVWHQSQPIYAGVEGPGKLLALMVVPDGDKFGATAIATPMEHGDGGYQLSMERILDNHSHDVIGEFTTQGDAKRACKAYAKKWLASEREAARCKCGPISKELHR